MGGDIVRPTTRPVDRNCVSKDLGDTEEVSMSDPDQSISEDTDINGKLN